jgi:hypothetical protein
VTSKQRRDPARILEEEVEACKAEIAVYEALKTGSEGTGFNQEGYTPVPPSRSYQWMEKKAAAVREGTIVGFIMNSPHYQRYVLGRDVAS